MADISKKQALKAYNLIRYYCRQECDCENCLFCKAYSYGCIFDDGRAIFNPLNWPELELD